MGIIIKQLKKEGIDDYKKKYENNKQLAGHNPFLNSTAEVFEWQFFSSSYNSSVYFIAIDDISNELIGTLAGLLIPMQMPNGEVGITIKPEDTLISINGIKKYRDRDILKELLDSIEKKIGPNNIKFYWGFTDAITAFERLGFTKKCSSRQGVMVFSPFAAYQHLKNLNPSNKLKQKTLIFGLSFFSYFRSIFSRRKTKTIRWEEVSLKEVNEGLLLSFLPPKMYSLYLNKEFLNWRIIENPSELKYHILQFKNIQKEIISYLIYSEKQKGVYFIEQFLFDGSLSIKQKQEITMSAVHHFKCKKAKIIRSIGFDHNKINKEECTILHNTGFIYTTKGIPFILKSTTEIKAEEIYLSRLNTQGTF